MNIPTGSPFWQAALLFGAFVFLLFEAWRGWRAGLVRTAVNLLALVVSGTFGFLAAQAAGRMFGGLGSPAGFLAGVVAGAVIGLGLFGVIWLLGAVLFKRTAHQSSGLFRFLWGVGGAFLGMVLGVLVLWGGISLVRGLGAVAEGRARIAVSRASPPPRVAAGMVTLKESLEMGGAGEFFQSVDLIPRETYDMVAKVSRVCGDERALLRFLEYPGIQALMDNPRIIELLGNPSVTKAAETHNYAALITHPALHNAIKDPALAARLRALDLAAALDFALEAQNPAPSAPHGNP